MGAPVHLIAQALLLQIIMAEHRSYPTSSCYNVKARIGTACSMYVEYEKSPEYLR
jgi:hypothetical protein